MPYIYDIRNRIRTHEKKTAAPVVLPRPALLRLRPAHSENRIGRRRAPAGRAHARRRSVPHYPEDRNPPVARRYGAVARGPHISLAVRRIVRQTASRRRRRHRRSPGHPTARSGPPARRLYAAHRDGRRRHRRRVARGSLLRRTDATPTLAVRRARRRADRRHGAS